eukprot:s2780_g13.t1
MVAASRARPSGNGALMGWCGLLLLSGTICFLPSALREPLVQSYRTPHKNRRPPHVGKLRLASQGSESDMGPAKRASNSGASFAWRFLLSLVTGAMVGSIQYLYVVSRHLQDCEWTLKADGLARRTFPSYLSGTSAGWLSWAVSSGWTWLFADVAHTAAKLQAILRATSGLLVGLLAVQLAWSSLAWLRGSGPDEKIGWQMRGDRIDCLVYEPAEHIRLCENSKRRRPVKARSWWEVLWHPVAFETESHFLEKSPGMGAGRAGREDRDVHLDQAPYSMLMDDKLGRSCFIIMAEAFGLIADLPKPQPGEVGALRAVCDSVQHCFSQASSSLLWTLRSSEPLRLAAEAIAEHFKDLSASVSSSGGEDDKPASILRLLDWIEVVMGGAWEVAVVESDLLTRALLDTDCCDVEEMVDTSVRLRSFTDKMEQKVQEWKAEEAELKLLEFEARCAKKALAYEDHGTTCPKKYRTSGSPNGPDRISRLEAEIARRAGSNSKLGLSSIQGAFVKQKPCFAARG